LSPEIGCLADCHCGKSMMYVKGKQGQGQTLQNSHAMISHVISHCLYTPLTPHESQRQKVTGCSHKAKLTLKGRRSRQRADIERQNQKVQLNGEWRKLNGKLKRQSWYRKGDAAGEGRTLKGKLKRQRADVERQSQKAKLEGK